jgi:uncharacterized protein (DUF58 family)
MVSLTRRGWGAIGVVAFGVGMSVAFGSRSLNALVAPVLLSVVAAVVVAYRADRPRVDRTVPGNGFVGTTHPVELSFDLDAPVSGVVEDTVGEGLASENNRVDTTVRGDTAIAYDLSYERRGVHRVGPVELTVRDVLGLAQRTFTYRGTDDVVVYPPVYDLTGGSRYDLNLLRGGAADREREEFDRLREYQRGDALRDVHWTTTAKRAEDDLVVMEFVSENEVGEMHVVAEAAPGCADRMAAAAASIAVFMLDSGIAVGVSAPGGRVPTDVGADHREAVLGLLARTDAGEPETTEDRADVRIVADEREVKVRIGDRERSFTALAGLDVGITDPDPDGDDPDRSTDATRSGDRRVETEVGR